MWSLLLLLLEPQEKYFLEAPITSWKLFLPVGQSTWAVTPWFLTMLRAFSKGKRPPFTLIKHNRAVVSHNLLKISSGRESQNWILIPKCLQHGLRECAKQENNQCWAATLFKKTKDFPTHQYAQLTVKRFPFFSQSWGASLGQKEKTTISTLPFWILGAETPALLCCYLCSDNKGPPGCNWSIDRLDENVTPIPGGKGLIY